MRRQLGNGLAEWIIVGVLGTGLPTAILYAHSSYLKSHPNRLAEFREFYARPPIASVSGTVIAETHPHPAEGLLGSSSSYVFSLRTGAGTETIILRDNSFKADSMIEPGFNVSVQIENSFAHPYADKPKEHYVSFDNIESITDDKGNRIK